MSRKAPPKSFVYCVDSPGFKPEEYVANDEVQESAAKSLADNDFQAAVHTSFAIPKPDFYVYHAVTSVTLAEANYVVGLGGVNGLHDWYRAPDGSALPPPSAQDIEGYVSIFSPTTVTASSLKGFLSNAKKASIRASVAAHLTEKRFIHPALTTRLPIPKTKKPPSPNPYLDFWAWSCRNLQWCGPCDASAGVTTSHHVLPVLMHHFGCAVPSHDALSLLRILADGRPVADVGSGNGYWTLMLRRYGLAVQPVDNMQSAWRVTWVDDTVAADGVRFLRQNGGGRDMVLLLVYPVVGGGAAGGVEGGFTRGLVKAYQGDTLAVVGTQNRNGYTGFRDLTMDEYMEREQPEWTKVVQVPLPSFAGKDEALFVFQRGERIPRAEGG